MVIPTIAMSVVSQFPPEQHSAFYHLNSISPKHTTTTMMRPTTAPMASAASTVRPGFRGKCRYKSGRCPNERTLKFNGEVHTMCEEHRIRHNNNQRKSDMKRRVKKHPETTEFVLHKRDLPKALMRSPVVSEVRIAEPLPLPIECTDDELEASRTQATEVVLSFEELDILHALLGIPEEEMLL
ncbi:hypothetical protein ACHHYP_10162 [Achlya hypogyna]|uniref:Uncharacterized protein n=1 Tax=Achlya hypogyna TaxID=1202772 RepID=A0A1V9ZHV7_ACHHY|nr:hypothetical protein ACHHYP_10162 [Achlya hypogyna]